MNGGSFGYVYVKIQDMAMQLQEHIDSNGSDDVDEYGDILGRDYSTETIDVVKTCQEILVRTAAIAHDVECLYSGDICEETFRRLVSEEINLLRKRTC